MRLASCVARDGWGDQTIPFSQPVAQVVECVLGVDFRIKLYWFKFLSRHISLSSARSWTRVSSSLPKKPSWFESHTSHISLYSHCSWTCASMSLRDKNNVCSSPTIGIFLYVSLRLNTFTEEKCSACVKGRCVCDPGGFVLSLFQGLVGGVEYIWKICSFNSNFRNKYIILCSSGLFETILLFKSCARITGLTCFRRWWLWKPKWVRFTDNEIKRLEELPSLN